MFKVGLDLGHGGTDPGAVGAQGLKEKDVNLAVGLMVAELLEFNRFQVLVTRKEDEYVSLLDRARMLNKAKVDLVVSLHVNSADDPRADYVATFILARGGKAEQAAKLVQQEVVLATRWRGPASPDGVLVKNLYLLRETAAPAILVEMGFITNPRHVQQLQEAGFRHRLAVAIAKGVTRFFGITFREPGTDPGETPDRIRIVVNGRELIPDVAPVLVKGRVMVPLRAIAEALGARVEWNASSRTVFVTSPGREVVVPSAVLYMNRTHSSKELKVAGRVRN